MRKVTNYNISYKQTVSQMQEMVKLYHNDLKKYKVMPDNIRLDLLSPERFFEVIKNIPYKRDPQGLEIIPRPNHILNFASKLGRDCKKMSILATSYAMINNIPFRYAVVSRRPDKKMHHIFPQLFLHNKWVDYDATYSSFKIDQKFNNTNISLFTF